MTKHVRRGFTLIELLIVVVIIGILAAIAIPKFAATKEKAYVATMRTDLRNLVTAEEGYLFATSGTYMPAATVTNGTQYNGYAPSAGVTITIAAPVANGWSATATNSNTTKKCGIFVAPATPPTIPGTTLVDGVVGCEP